MAMSWDLRTMLAELANVGVTVPHLNEDTIYDYYNQYIVNIHGQYRERCEFISIVLHPANSQLVDEYLWRR